jgi:hypothetical protein
LKTHATMWEVADFQKFNFAFIINKCKPPQESSAMSQQTKQRKQSSLRKIHNTQKSLNRPVTDWDLCPSRP